MSVRPLHNERELLRQLSQGDQISFRYIYDHYKDWVYSFALGIVREIPLAEEIVQESFTRVWLNREELPGLSKFEAWLFTITRNLCYSSLRKIAMEEKIREAPLDVNEELSPEEMVIYKENMDLVRQAVNQLSSQQKIVYTMSREQELSYKEIAEKLNISPNTVKEHLSRANAHIRKFLQARLPMAIFLIIHFFKK